MKTMAGILACAAAMAAANFCSAQSRLREHGPYGVNQRAFQREQRIFDAFVEAGIRWVRWGPEWHRHVKAPEKIDWSPKEHWIDTDGLMEELARSGLVYSLIVYDPPQALAKNPNRKGRVHMFHDRGVSPEAYAAFYGALIDRCREKGVKIGAYEILNEYATGGSIYDRDPLIWAPYYKAVHAEIRKRDASAPIVMDGMWGGDLHHLEEIYALGLNKYFDAANFHYYVEEMNHAQGYNPAWNGMNGWSAYVGPNPRQVSVNDLGFQLECMHYVMKKYNDVKPIWITEIGWRLQPEQVKAEWLAESLDICRRSGLVDRFFWYVGVEPDYMALVEGWNALEPGGVKTPAYYAYQDYIRRYPSWPGERNIVNHIPPASKAAEIPPFEKWPDAAVEPDAGPDGGPALRVDNEQELGAVFSAAVTVNCEDGRAYLLTGWLRVQEKAPAVDRLPFHALPDVEMLGWRGGPAIGNYFVGDTSEWPGGWRRLSVPIVPLRCIRQLRIRLGTWAGPGTAWLSGLKIEPLDIPCAPEPQMRLSP